MRHVMPQGDTTHDLHAPLRVATERDLDRVWAFVRRAAPALQARRDQVLALLGRGYFLVVEDGGEVRAAAHCNVELDATSLDLIAVDPRADARALCARLVAVARAIGEAFGRTRFLVRDGAAASVGAALLPA